MTLRQLLRVFVAALPDAISASVFLYAWFFPLRHQGLVTALLLVMLIEFLAIHSGALLGNVVRSRGNRTLRTKQIAAFSLLYGLFIAAFSYAFTAWWPIVWFVWLLASKLFAIWFDQHGSDRGERQRSYGILVLSMCLYLGGVMLTLLLPWPRFGLTEEVVGQLGFDATTSGIWVEQPHRLIAFGFVYFVGLAFGRGWQARRGQALFHPRRLTKDEK